MPIPKEVTEWLDTLELDADQRKTIEAVYEAKPEVANKVKDSVLMQRDYTAKTQAVADERKKFADEKAQWETQTNQYTEELATWKSGLETKLQDAVKQLEESKLRGAALESKVRSVANEFGVDADQLLADVKDVHVAKREEPQSQPQVDLSGYVKSDELNRLAQTAVLLPVQMYEFEREYRRLHGKEFEGDITALTQEAMIEGMKRKVPVKDYLAEKFEFDKMRQQQSAAQRQAEIDAAVKEAETRIRSEYAGHRPVNQPSQENVSPFLKKTEPKSDAPPRGSIQQDIQRRQSAYADFERRRSESQERVAS